MSSKPTSDQTIAALYAAAVEPDEWDAALASLTSMSGARAANCFMQNAVTGEFIEYYYSGYSDSAASRYVQYYAPLDLGFQALLKAQPGVVFSQPQILPDALVSRSEFYQDFYLPEGLQNSAGGSLFEGPNRVVLAVHLPTGAQHADAGVVRELQRVLNHLPNVFRVRASAARSSTQAWMTTAALEALPRPVVIVDGAMKVRYLNPRAHRLLAATRAVSIKAGRISASDPRLLQTLESRIKGACSPIPDVSAVPISSPDEHGTPAILINVVPLQPHLSPGFGKEDRLAMVLLHEPFSIDDWTNASERPYGLSRAEMAVVIAMIRGKTAVEHADSAGVTIATVRTQIKSILAKTGTRRMTEALLLFAASGDSSA